MIRNDSELKTTLDRIARCQAQITQLRSTESNPANYKMSAGGFIAELDRMQLEVREYLMLHPKETADTQAA
jgi:hypothetical protein